MDFFRGTRNNQEYALPKDATYDSALLEAEIRKYAPTYTDMFLDTILRKGVPVSELSAKNLARTRVSFIQNMAQQLRSGNLKRTLSSKMESIRDNKDRIRGAGLRRGAEQQRPMNPRWAQRNLPRDKAVRDAQMTKPGERNIFVFDNVNHKEPTTGSRTPMSPHHVFIVINAFVFTFAYTFVRRDVGRTARHDNKS